MADVSILQRQRPPKTKKPAKPDKGTLPAVKVMASASTRRAKR